MQLSDTSIKRPVLATVMSLIIVLVGLICYERLAVRLIPNVDEPIVTVSTSYPGANARVIESQITKPIEDALSGIEGVDFIHTDVWVSMGEPEAAFKERINLMLPYQVNAKMMKKTGNNSHV